MFKIGMNQTSTDLEMVCVDAEFSPVRDSNIFSENFTELENKKIEESKTVYWNEQPIETELSDELTKQVIDIDSVEF